MLISFFRALLRGTLFGVLALVFLTLAAFPHILIPAIGTPLQRLEALPDYDYLSEIRALQSDKRLMEAEQLADFVLAECDVATRSEVERLRNDIHENRTAFWNRTWRVVKGAAWGEGHSVEELGGSIASDMFLYGDVRDLVKQGYYKITGKETDPVVAALAGLGLATELVDAADWAPAVLKSFRKVGALTKKFSGFLESSCRKSVKARKLVPELADSFQNLKRLGDATGISRAATIMKHVDDADDLTAVARLAEKAPEAVTTAIRTEGKEGLSLAKRLSKEANGAETLALAAKKGPNGFALVKKVRTTARAGKILWKGQLAELLARLLPLAWIRALFATLAAFFGLRGGLNARKAVAIRKSH